MLQWRELQVGGTGDHGQTRPENKGRSQQRQHEDGKNAVASHTALHVDLLLVGYTATYSSKMSDSG